MSISVQLGTSCNFKCRILHESGFPIWTSVSRIVCSSCPGHNEFPINAIPDGDRDILEAKSRYTGLPKCGPNRFANVVTITSETSCFYKLPKEWAYHFLHAVIHLR